MEKTIGLPSKAKVLQLEYSSNRLHLEKYPYLSSKDDMIEATYATLELAFSQQHGNPIDRCIYILAGFMFWPHSALPFGGPKGNPGFAQFNGDTPQDLLRFIVTGAVKKYRHMRGRDALDLVVGCANKVLELEQLGAKDVLDEYMLKGMKKAGHVPFFGASYIPPRLQHVPGQDCQPWGKLFSVKRGSLGPY
ncbi:hypothetical protein BJ741DRAFT_625336 [Chytriomyces cf. hyalinus JEL632]|nr:hypothetical protein BJ741DRAFT_625336 [Chytriomyces cf. hyalinus JEL632]